MRQFVLGLAILCSIVMATPGLSVAGDVEATYARLAGSFDAADATVRKDAREAWQSFCLELSRPGREKQRPLACIAMIDTLRQSPSRSVAQFLLRQLERIGGTESVGPLGALMGSRDPIVQDAARRALMNNPAPAATVVLGNELKRSKDPEDQVRLIHAVGFRSDRDTVTVLGPYLEATRDDVVAAAAAALAKVATAEAAESLQTALRDENHVHPQTLATALLAIGDQWRQQGDREGAGKLFAYLENSRTESAVKAGALRGRLLTAGDDAGKLVLEALRNEDAIQRQVAIGAFRELTPEALKTVLRQRDAWPPEVLAALYPSLAGRDESIVRETLRDASASGNDPSIRAAAVAALGRVAAANDVPLLMELLGSPEQSLAAAAERAITAVPDPAASGQLLEELRATRDPELAKKLMDILIRRRATDLSGFAAQQLTTGDPELRKRARVALARLGTPVDTERLVLSVDAVPREEREDVFKAVVSICQRIPDEHRRADPVIALFADSPQSQRPLLLEIIGRIGGRQAADLVTSRLESDNVEEQDAALAALANWPDSSVTDTLLELARNTDDERVRNRAVRGLARVVVLPKSSLSDQRQLTALKEAMTLATRTRDQELIVDRAKAIDLIDTIRFVRPYLDDEQLAPAACKAIVHLARVKSLREQYPEVMEDLRKVIEATDDERVARRAETLLSEI